jgi:uncharacterized alpha/beta hydrolase family protein
MAGNLTIEQCGEIFAPKSRQASSNYGVGSDGRIALYVDESDRAWTSGSTANDNQAVTIEVANSAMGGDWPVSDKALAALIDLCADICKRNGIRQLNFTGDANGNLTMHKYFAATACPGPYLEKKFPYIAEQVNKRLEATGEDLLSRMENFISFDKNYWGPRLGSSQPAEDVNPEYLRGLIGRLLTAAGR